MGTPSADAYSDALEGLVAFINDQWSLPTLILIGGYPDDIDDDDPPYVWVEHRDISSFTHPSMRERGEALKDYVTRIPLAVWYIQRRAPRNLDLLDLSKTIIEPFKLAIIGSSLPVDGGTRTVTRVECSGVDYSDKANINLFFQDREMPLVAAGVIIDLIIRE
jgi:hypothetical protein